MFSRISNFPLSLLFLIHSEFSKLCFSHLFNPYIPANLLFSNCLLASSVHFSVPSMRSVLFFNIFTLRFGFLSLEVISRLTLGPLPVSLFFHMQFLIDCFCSPWTLLSGMWVVHWYFVFIFPVLQVIGSLDVLYY